MFEVTRFEGQQRIRGSLVLTAIMGLFGLLVIYLFPSIVEAGESVEDFVESLPPAMQEGFVGSGSYTTIEGFLSAELYQFLWVIMLAIYIAYVAGGSVAGDIESGRMDMLLAAPISRARVVFEKFLSLLVPILVVNLVMPFLIYAGLILIGESIDFIPLLAVHVFAVPYLLACAAIGLVLSVSLSRADLAQRGGLGVVFGLFMLDAVTIDTDVEFLGVLSPSHYYSPAELLAEETYDLLGLGLLIAAAICLVILSIVIFERRDI